MRSLAVVCGAGVGARRVATHSFAAARCSACAVASAAPSPPSARPSPSMMARWLASHFCFASSSIESSSHATSSPSPQSSPSVAISTASDMISDTISHVGPSSFESHDALAAATTSCDGRVDATSAISVITRTARSQLGASSFDSHAFFAPSCLESMEHATRSPPSHRRLNSASWSASDAAELIAAAALLHVGASTSASHSFLTASCVTAAPVGVLGTAGARDGAGGAVAVVAAVAVAVAAFGEYGEGGGAKREGAYVIRDARRGNRSS